MSYIIRLLDHRFSFHPPSLVVLAETENGSERTDGVVVVGSTSVVSC